MSGKPLSDADQYSEIPSEGVLLGFDYGTVRVGIAVSTREQTIASPLENFNRLSAAADGKYFAELAHDYRAVGIIVGLPIHLHGGESQKSVESQNWGQWLGEQTGLPIAYYDERFTSSIAEDQLHEAGVSWKKQKSRVDMLAAQGMLQAFLDYRQRVARDKAALEAEQNPESENEDYGSE